MQDHLAVDVSLSLFVYVADSCLNSQGDTEEEDENLPIQEISFDPEKAQCCVVENSQGLTHGSGGKGYGLASTGISSGCYQWKVQYFSYWLIITWRQCWEGYF